MTLSNIFEKFRRLWQHNPARLPVIFFLLVMVFLPQDGFVNANARIGTMAAIITEKTFAINDFLWTIDWARSPVNHRMYSNKPPGPAIVGAPIYYLLDKLAIIKNSENLSRGDQILSGQIISIILQAIPYAFLVLLIARWLQEKKVSDIAIHFGVIAILFGNTASLFMNSYFGHGMAALCVLFTAYFFLSRRYFLSGLFIGAAFLADYGAALVVLPLIIGIIIREHRNSVYAISNMICGISPPLLVSVIYHWAIFGHPFAMATQYSNPIFVDTLQGRYKILGIFSSTISLPIIQELLFGARRGLLVTQPWVLVIIFEIVCLFFEKKIKSKSFLALMFIAVTSLMLLIAANGAFIFGWLGGGTPGPRYISLILPVFGIVVALLYKYLSRTSRVVLWLALSVSLVLFVVAYSTTILASEYYLLWPFYWNNIHSSPILPLIPRMAIISLCMILIVITPFLTNIRDNLD